MKQYIAFTSEGTATVYASSLNEAWQQASATYAEVSDVQLRYFAGV